MKESYIENKTLGEKKTKKTKKTEIGGKKIQRIKENLKTENKKTHKK